MRSKRDAAIAQSVEHFIRNEKVPGSSPGRGSKVNNIIIYTMKKEIKSTKAPGAIGPYSQAVVAGNFIYVSGQLPINAETGEMPEDIKGQTAQSIANIKAILAEVGATLDNVVKTTVLLADMSLFGAMNEVYASEFKEVYPARCAFAVKELPKQALVEIEVVAVI